MTAPESSVMVPRKTPVPGWAIAIETDRATASNKLKVRRNLGILLLNGVLPLLLDNFWWYGC